MRSKLFVVTGIAVMDALVSCAPLTCTMLAGASAALALSSCESMGSHTPSPSRVIHELTQIGLAGPLDESPVITFVVPAVPMPLVTDAGARSLADKAEPSAPDSARARHIRKGANRFELVLSDVERFEAEQQDVEWCWAACAQMINAYRGVPLRNGKTGEPATQAELAKYYKRDAKDQTANLALVIRSLAPEMEPEMRGRCVTLGASLRVMSTDVLIDALACGDLAVVGLREEDGSGHACVAIGVQYSWIKGGQAIVKGRQIVNGNAKLLHNLPESFRQIPNAGGEWINALAVHELTIFDPWDGGSVQKLSGKDLEERCMFVMTPSLARSILSTPQKESLGGNEGLLESSLSKLLK